MLIQPNSVDEGTSLTERPRIFHPRLRESLISAVSVGFFFLLVGAIFVATPNLFDRIVDLYRDFEIRALPHTDNIFLPAPMSPYSHTEVYTAVWQFSVVWGIFQIFILAFRYFAGSPFRKKTETAGNLVFWLSASYFIGMFRNATSRAPFLNTTTPLEGWCAFWAMMVILIGVSLIVRAIILAARYAMTR
jgi:hypothetical protein